MAILFYSLDNNEIQGEGYADYATQLWKKPIEIYNTIENCCGGETVRRCCGG